MISGELNIEKSSFQKQQKRAEKVLSLEAPVQLFYNSKEIATFLCTPHNLREFTVGWLFSQGLIESLDEINILSACEEMSKITVITKEDRFNGNGKWTKVLTSGCGGGIIFKKHLQEVIEPVTSSLCLSVRTINHFMKEMVSNARLYKLTGGIHSAALADSQEILFIYEDVGRHNAVDKVIGKGIFAGVNFGQTILLTTGRISSDIVLKAARAKIPIISSLSIPTTLALEIAEASNICLVGRAISTDFVIYGNEAYIKPF